MYSHIYIYIYIYIYTHTSNESQLRKSWATEKGARAARRLRQLVDLINHLGFRDVVLEDVVLDSDSSATPY